MRLLMTGATGFLGSRLLHRLMQFPSPPEVTVLKRSTSPLGRIASLLPMVTTVDLDRTTLASVFDGPPFDAVIHCATNYGRGVVDRGSIIEANLLLPLRLLDLAIAHGTRAFVNTDTMLDKNISAYTLSKRQFREWLRRCATELVCIDILLEHFYGPGDDETKFIASVIGALLREEPEIRLTPGEQTRDFIFIEDVTEAFVTVLDALPRLSGYHEFEVGRGEAVPLRRMVELARDLSGNTTTRLAFGALPYRTDEAMHVQADIAPLVALGYRPRWSLGAGLGVTIDTERAHRLSRPTDRRDD